MKTQTIEIKTRYGSDTWTLSPECIALVAPIAEKLRLSVTDFIHKVSAGDYLSTDEIPEKHSVPCGFSVSLPADADMRMRIERAAALDGNKTVEAFAWEALVSWVNLSEESMIFTDDGEAAGDLLELEEFREKNYNDADLRFLQTLKG